MAHPPPTRPARRAFDVLEFPGAQSPGYTVPGAGPPGPAAPMAGPRQFTADEIGRSLLSLLGTLRLQSLSLHNASGELLWLSEGVFGPDENGYVLDALKSFAAKHGPPRLERRLDDDRRSLFLCARTPLGECCGLACVIAEARSEQAIESELDAAQIAVVMRHFSMWLAPPLVRPAPPAAALPPAAAAPPRKARATAPRPAIAVPLAARSYLRLRPGGTTRRYEIELPRDATASPAGDLRLARCAIEHLQRERERYQQEPSSFTVPLSAPAVLSQSFLKQITTLLNAAQLPEGMLGFSLPSAAWSQETPGAGRFMRACAQARCFVTLDAFNLGRPGFELLRQPALRCLKLDPALVGPIVTDKFAQATVAAIVQAARVLGLHCVAVNADTSQAREWLAAAGIEFADQLSRGPAGAATRKDVERLTLDAASGPPRAARPRT